MEDFIENVVQPYFNYWAYVIIMMIGLWALIGKRNLIKKLIGMSIFQTAIILFYISIGVKEGATIPIVEHHGHSHAAAAGLAPDHKGHGVHSGGMKEKEHHGEENGKGEHGPGYHAGKPEADQFVNPLPHVLMLTAIVVGVATLGVALAVTQAIFRTFGTLEEPEILQKIKTGDYRHG